VVVEMQNARPMSFANRLLFYSTYPIRNQAPKRVKASKSREENDKDKKRRNAGVMSCRRRIIVVIVNFPMLNGKDLRTWR
jgi:hypothetical protein